MNFNIEEAKYITNQFINYVKGNSAHVLNEKGHDGSVGHLLEDLFKLERDSHTAPDFESIELKVSAPKVTLGDWSPDIGNYSLSFNPKDGRKGKQQYLDDYGTINEKGHPHVTGPFYGDNTEGAGYKRTGMKLNVNKNLYLVDTINNINVVGWTFERLKKFTNEKFGRGTAVVDIDKKNNTFHNLYFHDGFDIDYFYKGIKEGYIIYDPGTNIKRPYSQFRFRRRGFNGIEPISYKKILTL